MQFELNKKFTFREPQLFYLKYDFENSMHSEEVMPNCTIIKRKKRRDIIFKLVKTTSR